MSKTETFRQSATAANETRLERLASQIEAVRQARHQSVEDLAAMLEPLAQAMAALTDETRQTLVEIDRQSREQAERFKTETAIMVRSCQEAAQKAQKATDRLDRAGRRLGRGHFLLVALLSMATAAAVSASLNWLELSQKAQAMLDARAVSEAPKPALIESGKQSRGK